MLLHLWGVHWSQGNSLIYLPILLDRLLMRQWWRIKRQVQWQQLTVFHSHTFQPTLPSTLITVWVHTKIKLSNKLALIFLSSFLLICLVLCESPCAWQVADLYGIRATLVDGGEIRGAGNAWICPEVMMCMAWRWITQHQNRCIFV